MREARWLMPAAWAVSVAVAAVAGWWAAGQATQPPTVPAPQSQIITTDVVEGTVEVTQAYGIDVAWPASPVGTDGADGTVTSLAVKRSGTRVERGDTLYTLDLRPVLALQGSVPAFRTLREGQSGRDVRQLQRFLRDGGYLSSAADGRFRASTKAAVNRCWKKLGLKQDGIVPLGRVVFIPALPATLAVADNVRVGTRVTAGQELLVGAVSPPVFSFRVLPEAVGRTTQGLRVSIDAAGRTWAGRVDRLAADPDDETTTIAILAPVQGRKTICGADCAKTLVLGGKTVLPGSLILVPPTKGPLIPTAAIRTNASGDACVGLADGGNMSVSVKASSDDGRSIVDGLTVGQRVVVTGREVTC